MFIGTDYWTRAYLGRVDFDIKLLKMSDFWLRG